MGHGVRERKREVERLSRGQSHDLLTRLENVGLTPRIAAAVVTADEGCARAIVEVVRDPQAWVKEIRTWFQAYLFDKVKVPPLNVSLGERVERALRNHVPFYLPSTRELTMPELLDPHGPFQSRIDLRWGDVGASDVAPFSTIEEGYWFWMEIGGDRGWFEREQAVKRAKSSYFTSERIAVHAASLEEFLIGFFFGEALGRPLQFGKFGQPDRTLVLRTQVQMVRDRDETRETRDEFLVSRRVLKKGQEWGPAGLMMGEFGFNWSTSTLGELYTEHNAYPDGWDYCWVERIPASDTKAA